MILLLLCMCVLLLPWASCHSQPHCTYVQCGAHWQGFHVALHHSAVPAAGREIQIASISFGCAGAEGGMPGGMPGGFPGAGGMPTGGAAAGGSGGPTVEEVD